MYPTCLVGIFLKQLVMKKVQRQLQLITFVIMFVVKIHCYFPHNVLIFCFVIIDFIIYIKMNMIILNIIMKLTACMASRNVIKIVLIRWCKRVLIVWIYLYQLVVFLQMTLNINMLVIVFLQIIFNLKMWMGTIN